MEESATSKNEEGGTVLPSSSEPIAPKNGEGSAVVTSTSEPATVENGESRNVLPSMSELETAMDELDEDLENAFGRAADSIWGFANTFGTVVRKRQPGLDALRKNVTDRLQPLDTLSRDLGSQFGALAPKEESIASLTGSITGSISSVAKTVQRNASAVEAAILAKANSSVSEISGISGAESIEKDTSSSGAKPAIPFVNEGVEGLAKVSETLTNSIVGQTVGGFWDGLWGGEEEDEEEEDDDEVLDNVPRTRFEQRLFELQGNPDTYCKPASNLEAFNKWGEDFDLDDVAEQCRSILRKFEGIAELYVKVVPSLVEENTFWMRYFFAKHVLEVEEERRRKLIEQAETAVEGNDAEDDGWGDDWPDADDGDEPKVAKSDTAKDDKPQETQSEASNAAGKTEATTPQTEPLQNDSKQENKTPVTNADATAVATATTDNVDENKDSDGWSDDDWE